MKSHYVIKDGIDEWLTNTTREYAAHHGSGYNKSLEVSLKGEWIVMNHRKEIYRGDIDTAIDTYNSILPIKQ